MPFQRLSTIALLLLTAGSVVVVSSLSTRTASISRATTTLPARATVAQHRHMVNGKRARTLSDNTFLLSSPDSHEKDDDLFEYFDPLLSPHAYPDGIAPNKKPQELQTEGGTPSPVTTSKQTTKRKAVGFTLPKNAATQTQSTPSPKNNNQQKGDGDDLFDYFDPLLSPHAYPQGVSPSHKPTELQNGHIRAPSLIQTKTVGILLMDHGSKKQASNARLQAMAQLYQASMDEQYNDSTAANHKVIVKAAHMEIATPSIPDGLQALLDAGADEIVCHPFFLSPDGRHVKEDIPEIIEGAIKSLNIQVPVITTAPVGSNVDLMLSVVHALVVENSQVLEE